MSDPSSPMPSTNESANFSEDDEITSPTNKRLKTESEDEFDDFKSQELLAEAIIMHNLPFEIVDAQGFIRYVRSLRPECGIPAVSAIIDMIKSKYERERAKLHEKFASLSSRVSLTVDKWAAAAASQNLSYLRVTARYVDDEWVLRKRIIGFIDVHGSTGEDICTAFIDRLLDWNIESKLFSVTVFSDKTNVVAIRHAKKRLEEFLVCDGIFFHVRWANLLINLIVQDGLRSFGTTIEKVRQSIRYVTCSPEMEASFYEIAKDIGITSQKRLSLDVCPRWDTTSVMLADALHYKDAFIRFQLRDNEYSHCPCNDEWNHVEALSKCLKRFLVATKHLFSTEYPTCTRFFETFCEVHFLLIEWGKSNSDVFVDVSMAMKVKFDMYWNLMIKILAVASFIDPRYKMEAVRFYCKVIYGEVDGIRHATELFSVIKMFYDEYADNAARNGNESTCNSASRPRVGENARSDFTSMFEEYMFEEYMESKRNEPSKSDLDIYMQERILKWNEAQDGSFDILGWWKVNIGKYPIVGRMARDVLGIIVASESAHSTGVHVVDSYRSKLTPDIVEALFCTQDWLTAREEVGVVDSLVDDVSNMDVSPSLALFLT